MTRIFCKSGVCDRDDGFAISEVSTSFDPDQTQICKKCKIELPKIRAREAERYRVVLEKQRVEKLAHDKEDAVRRAERIANEISKVMLARNEPNFVVERSTAWTSGPQHLGGPFYQCPQCEFIKHDPQDFDLIYKRNKKPLFNGNTLCDQCFAANNIR